MNFLIFFLLIILCFHKDIFNINLEWVRMLNFHRILTVNDSFYHNLYNLYTLAFPIAERRSWAGLEYELIYEKRFCPHALIKEDKFVGLFNYWIFDRFFYVEHIAVAPTMRGQGIGAEAMEIFKSQTKLPIVFEVEMPTNPTSIGRINFYEKLGFLVLSHNYAQPPYEGEQFLLPMQLMSNDKHFAETHFDLIKKTLYRDVYHYHIAEKDLISN